MNFNGQPAGLAQLGERSTEDAKVMWYKALETAFLTPKFDPHKPHFFAI